MCGSAATPASHANRLPASGSLCNSRASRLPRALMTACADHPPPNGSSSRVTGTESDARPGQKDRTGRSGPCTWGAPHASSASTVSPSGKFAAGGIELNERAPVRFRPSRIEVVGEDRIAKALGVITSSPSGLPRAIRAHDSAAHPHRAEPASSRYRLPLGESQSCSDMCRPQPALRIALGVH